MKELQELEQKVTEVNQLLVTNNWLMVGPNSSFMDAHSRIVQVRSLLLDAVFHSDDIIDAIQWAIDRQPGDGDFPQKTQNASGVIYSTEDLLKLRLKALKPYADPLVFDDILKFVKMYADEFRREIAVLLHANRVLTNNNNNNNNNKEAKEHPLVS